MHHVAPPHPALKREQSKNHQGPSSKLRIRDRRPRQHSKYDVRDKSCCKAIHCLQILRDQRSGFHHWCTGKDSNLRTSLGGTDLQSVGFNHSPTCALAVSVEQRALSNHSVARSSSLTAKNYSDTPQPSLRFAHCHWDQKVRVRTYPRQQLIWKIPLWSADGK